ncbi:MAG: hypothetical protein AVDCRST_MAG67-3300, partial [uncultured Solirubrobacteraceae bacterium]
ERTRHRRVVKRRRRRRRRAPAQPRRGGADARLLDDRRLPRDGRRGRRPVVFARRLRADLRGQPRAARLDDGRARAKPRARSAREPRAERSRGKRRPAGPAAHHAGRPCRAARGGDTSGGARRARRRDPRRDALCRLGRLHAVGARGAARALGRRVRRHGNGQRRGLPRGRARPHTAGGGEVGRAPQQGPPRRAAGDRSRAGRHARGRRRGLHRHRPLRDRPQLHGRGTVRRRARVLRRAAAEGRRRAPRDRSARQAGARAAGRL